MDFLRLHRPSGARNAAVLITSTFIQSLIITLHYFLEFSLMGRMVGCGFRGEWEK